MNQMTFEAAFEARDRALEQVATNAGSRFREDAEAFVIAYLTSHGSASGEDITDACKAAGIKPHDDRAFGPVYQGLRRRGEIEWCGYSKRRKGHGTNGGNVWRLKSGE